MPTADTLADHHALVRSLLAQLAAQPGARAELIETHISSLLLAGDAAWKLRKPLALGFLDFSTAELRRADCEAELALNRRTAPALYLEVLPVHGPLEAPRLGGPAAGAIDWALRMRRFDNALLLDRLAREGRLGADLVDALAARVAAFHQALPPSPAAFGAPEQAWAWMQDNLDTLAAAALAPPVPAEVATLAHWSLAAYTRLAPLMAARRAQGRVREGHGDLHLGNIVLWQGEPTLFDAIEFNPALRHIDVVADVAFTFMDLLRHGLPALAWRFISAWAEHTGDHAGLALLHLHAVYRALVRAKVAWLRGGEAGSAEALAACARDVALAQALASGEHAPRAAPRLLITQGLSGSGKSGVALRVVEQLGAIRLRSDVERKRLHGLAATDRGEPGLYTPAATERTFAHLANTAEHLLHAGLHVVVDAAFLRRAERQRFRALAAACGARFTLLACSAAPEVLRQRVAQRAAAAEDASDATPEVLERQFAFAERPDADEAAFVLPTDQGEPALAAALAPALL